MIDKKAAAGKGGQPTGKRASPKSARKTTSTRVAAVAESSEVSSSHKKVPTEQTVLGDPPESVEIQAHMNQTESASVSQLQLPSRVEDQPTPSSTEKTAEAAAVPSTSPRRVLDVFLVDSGWNNEVGKAVRENLPVFADYLHGQRFYVLSEEQSLDFIRRHPSLVGADPILIVLDREAAKQKNPKGFGFRLCLGHMRNHEAAISMLKWAIQLSMATNGPEMATIVKESGHRQTIQGTIELIGEGTAHLLEFAPV